MTAEEYDEFIDDPTAFTISKYLPRVYGTMKPLEALPPIKALLLGYFGIYASLLQAGTPDTVEAYAKKLIDVAGKDGGFIVGPKSAMDETNPDLVKVWFDFTKEYWVCTNSVIG